MFTLDPTITFGQALTIGVPVASTLAVAFLGWLVNRTKNKVVEIIEKMFKEWTEASVERDKKTREAFDERFDGANDKIDAKIVEFNGRLTDLSKGVFETGQKLEAFKGEVRDHYVRNEDLAKVETGLQTSVSELKEDVRVVNGTVEDVRDGVNRMEAKLFPDRPSELPPRRPRPSRAKVG